MKAAILLAAIQFFLVLPCWAHSPADLVRDANLAYDHGDFVRCARLYGEAIASGRKDGTTYYNAACAYALGGDADSALVMLNGAVAHGFQNTKLLHTDADLSLLRGNPRWSAVVAACSTQAIASQRMWDSDAWHRPFRDPPTLADKITGLSRLWATAKYNFVNFDQVPDLDWDAALFGYVDSVAKAVTMIDYYRCLETMCAQLGDGHTYVIPPRELKDRLWSRPLIRTRLMEGRVVVVDVYGSTPETAPISLGDELIAIDGVPVVAYAQTHVRPYQFASTPQDLDSKTYESRLLAGAKGSTVALEFGRADGGRYPCRLKRYYGDDRSRHIPKQDPMKIVEFANGVTYLALNTFNTQETADMFEAVFDKIAAAEAIVIDLRENGGGNSSIGYQVLGHLTGDTYAGSAWYTREYRPAHRAWGRAESRYEGGVGLHAGRADGHYAGPVVVLTSPRTYSAAEDFLVAFRNMKRGLIIGEPSGGSTGQPLMVSLGCGISAAVCSKRDHFPDGTEFVGVGITPDITATQTIADIRAGRDTVLERAVRELGERDSDDF